MLSADTNNYYIESSNIRIFPCAYRGYYKTISGTTDAKVFDPEARATTEANFTDTFHKLSTTKASYVIDWIPADPGSPMGSGTLKCVIGGYYFEIYNHRLADFFYEDSNGDQQSYYLCIQTESVELGTSDQDGNRTTRVLKSFANTTNYLDIHHASSSTYVFTGLLLSKSSDTGTERLQPGVAVYTYTESSNQNKEDSIGKYYLNGNQYTKITSISADLDGKKIYERTVAYKINPCQLPITSLLDVGNGEYSLRMLEDIINGQDNTTIANGDYAVALGRHTIASGTASIALGDNSKATGKGATALGNNTEATGSGSLALGNADTTDPTKITKATAKGAAAIGNYAIASNTGALAVGNTVQASGEGAIALGNNTSAQGKGAIAAGNDTKAVNKGSVAFGTHTETRGDNQVVIGTYNNSDDSQAFIIANGTSTTKKNIFTVSYEGNTKTLGNLEVNGNKSGKPAIASIGSAANDLVLGTTTNGSYGSVTVYGKEDKAVFTVDFAGKTEVADQLTVTGATQLRNKLTISDTVTINSNIDSDGTDTGALVVKGGVGVEGTIYAKNIITTDKAATIIANTTSSTSTDTGALVIGGGIGIAENLFAGGTLNVTEAATLGDTLKVTGKATLDDALDVTGTATIKDTLAVTGAATLGDTLKVTGKATLDNALEVAGAAAIKGTLAVTGAATLNADLKVGNQSNKFKVEAETGDTRIHGTLDVKSTTSLSDTLTVTGDASFRGNLTIAGTANKTYSLDIGSSDTNVCGQLNVYGTGDQAVFSVDSTGNTKIQGTAEISTVKIKSRQAANSNDGALVVAGGIKAGAGLYVTGNTTIAGNTTITGTLNAGDVKIEGSAISGISNLTLNGKLETSTITASGQITASSFNAASDMRLKCNIEDYTFKKSILDLPLKRFEYIKDDTHTKYIGCLAQDLQEICPELVNKNPEGILSIQESKLVYALLQEVKELKERIELLERR